MELLVLIIFIFVLLLFYLKFEVWTDNYEKLLKNKKWKERREEILERDNYCCQWCGKTFDLQIHHKYYNKYPNGKMVKPWDYPDDCFLTLCSNCHKKYHHKYKVKTYYRKY